MSVLEVNHVSVRYLTGDFKDIGLKEYVMRKAKGNYHVHEFWADRDITFSLEKGDMLGIIGTNGAGKSTILKVISGIMEPSKGYVKRDGNVAALLELASGFDGELTVRENTYLRGAMLGFTREFMDQTYDKIISFAELEEFQDRPFKQLSSGMKARLAFSIASLVEPQILILDEVLSVGDGAFRQKSEAKMQEIIHGGATTILVSHSVSQVEELCNKVLWLHKGEQIAFGETQKICTLYRQFLSGEITIEEAKKRLNAEGRTKKIANSPQDSYPQVMAAPLGGCHKEPVSSISKRDLLQSVCLFLFAFLLLSIYLLDRSPIIGGDASSIWQSIVGLAEGTPVGSYVMYKGFMSCYPYVWFYKLSKLLGLPTFFFLKAYHAALFAYITTIGVPYVVRQLFHHKPRWWQIIPFTVIVYILWQPTSALDQLMVDLPCCAFFFFSVQMAIRLGKPHKRYGATVALAGLFCGLNATVSGQYGLAMMCILFYSCIRIFLLKNKLQSSKRCVFYILLMLLAYFAPYVLQAVFMDTVVAPLVAAGAFIPESGWWLQRGLLLMFDRVENFPMLYIARGKAILESIYGSPEAAAAAQVAADTQGWSVGTWLLNFARYPLDYLAIMLNRAFICVTTDARSGNVAHMITGYTLLFVTIVEMIRHAPTIKSAFKLDTLLILSALLTIIPLLPLPVEARCTISFQGLIFGVALMGPILEDTAIGIVNGLKGFLRGEIKPKEFKGYKFPWTFLIGIFFVWVCLTHYGDIVAQTTTGVGLLFTR